MSARVLLLMPTTSYKAEDFLEAAGRLGVEVVVGGEQRSTLEGQVPQSVLTVAFDRPERGLATIVEAHRRAPFAAVIGTDDESTLLAALAGEALGLPHNPPAAARAARDKLESRQRFQAAGLRGPRVRRVGLDEPPEEIAAGLAYPCVLKPLHLAASRGVVRADDPPSFVAAFRRVAAIVHEAESAGQRALLVEDYIPGHEVALEGLLRGGGLEVLAIFDKPDPLEGPFFEETIYVTPSRLPPGVQAALSGEAAAACRALGLREGAVHAELRIHEGQPWMLEVAPRTIGGLCSRTLRFGAGVSLEELILHHALGRKGSLPAREASAAGVMMIPIPRAGVFAGVEGLDEARSVPGIEDLQISVHRGSEILPPPEGHRYLGFIFARGTRPQAVEAALRAAHARLRVRIDAAGG
jgi:biotin carboxylase